MAITLRLTKGSELTYAELDGNFTDLNSRLNSLPDSSRVSTIILNDVNTAYVQARQTPQDFAYASLTGTPNILDSAHVSSIILADVDAAYVQSRETPQDFSYSSLTGAPTNVSSFTNDAGYLTAATTVDSAEVSSIILNDVDATYVQARQTPQDFAYASLTGAPTNVSQFANDAGYLTAAATIDSANVVGIVDSDYVESRVSKVQLDVYTINTAPAGQDGQLIFVSDGDAGNPCLAVYSGGNYYVVSSLNTVIDSAGGGGGF
jgi:hypothetical protein